jgi:hypothetical protein
MRELNQLWLEWLLNDEGDDDDGDIGMDIFPAPGPKTGLVPA